MAEPIHHREDDGKLMGNVPRRSPRLGVLVFFFFFLRLLRILLELRGETSLKGERSEGAGSRPALLVS